MKIIIKFIIKLIISNQNNYNIIYIKKKIFVQIVKGHYIIQMLILAIILNFQNKILIILYHIEFQM